MPQKSLTRKIIHFLLRTNLKKDNFTKTAVNYKNSKKIAVLYKSVSIDPLPEIIDFTNKIRNENKDLYILEYLPKSNKNTFKIWKHTHFYLLKKNFNFLNIPRSQDMSDFTGKHYDILINLSMDDDLNLHYICSLCRANIKIGLYNPVYSDIYDFMIDRKDIYDQDSLIRQVSKYLTMINSTAK
jgi:hypothetical protein